MRISGWLSVGLLVLVIGCVADRSEEITQLKQEIADLEALLGPPPSSLDSLYPPRSKAPVFQIGMFEMGTPFAGIVIDMQRGDRERARAHFERFKAQYVEASRMVPEWEQAYPMEPVEELGALLRAGKQERVMSAFGNVARVCHDCHVVNMPKVQQKYHWEDFSGIDVTDPVAQEEVGFDRFMSRLEVSFQGIGIDLEQGRVDEALKHFGAFRERFQAMKETCEVCHDTERAYFVDANVQGLVDNLGATLRSASPDPKMVGALSQEIGTESCLKCHWVHIPATYTRARWKEGKKPRPSTPPVAAVLEE